jgi:hypothetical protein
VLSGRAQFKSRPAVARALKADESLRDTVMRWSISVFSQT